MRNLVTRLANDEEGAALVEYAVLVGLNSCRRHRCGHRSRHPDRGRVHHDRRGSRRLLTARYYGASPCNTEMVNAESGRSEAV
jgi:hypothetical protein